MYSLAWCGSASLHQPRLHTWYSMHPRLGCTHGVACTPTSSVALAIVCWLSRPLGLISGISLRHCVDHIVSHRALCTVHCAMRLLPCTQASSMFIVESTDGPLLLSIHTILQALVVFSHHSLLTYCHYMHGIENFWCGYCNTPPAPDAAQCAQCTALAPFVSHATACYGLMRHADWHGWRGWHVTWQARWKHRWPSSASLSSRSSGTAM